MTNATILETVLRDTRYTLRAMRQNPGFTATAILTLALAIGGNTAIFTVIRAVLLKPLPYPDSDQLVHIQGDATPARFAEMRAAAHSFTGLGAYSRRETLTLSGGAEPEVLKGVRVSANFLEILRTEPALGRSFRPQEDSLDIASGAPPVVLISAELWERRFGRDPQILGKTATLSGIPYTIIGVVPPRFEFPFAGLDLWLTAPSASPLLDVKSRLLSPFLTIFGRLKPGVTLAQANAELKVIRGQYARTHPARLDAKPKFPTELIRMKDELVVDVRSMLWMLLGAVGFVLLIACANVAGLLLARATRRSREFAIRAALGANRARLIGQLLGECLILSLSAGVLGILLAAWAVRAVPSITSFDLPRSTEIHLDWTVLAFAVALSLSTGVLFGLAPALGASRPDLIRALRTAGQAATQNLSRRMLPGVNVRELLLILQVALSIVLLIGAALLIQSITRLRGVSIGFNPAHLLTANVTLAPTRYDTEPKRALFFKELVSRIQIQPGIRSAAAAMFLPMMGYPGTPVQDASKPLLQLNERLIVTFSPVTPGYFQTLQIPFRSGRDFTDRDTAETQRVTIIDEALARRFWPEYPRGRDPIGQHLWIGGINPKPAEIIGIVANVHKALEKSTWPETVYVAFAQNAQPFAFLAVRTEADPLRFAGAVRAAVHSLDKDQTISAVERMDDLVDAQIGQRRLLVILLSGFALMALLLVLIGIYGVIAYSVAQRTQEMGVRRALGAQQFDILRLVVGQSLGLALAGIIAGILGALAVTRLFASLLFQVSATDPGTFVFVVVLFLLITLAASYIPARRATRIDPVAALRIS